MSAELPASPTELCAYLVRRLVDDVDAVRVETTTDDEGTVLVVHVAADDRGKVIGREGRVVRALRSVVRAGGIRAGERLTVHVAEE